MNDDEAKREFHRRAAAVIDTANALVGKVELLAGSRPPASDVRELRRTRVYREFVSMLSELNVFLANRASAELRPGDVPTEAEVRLAFPDHRKSLETPAAVAQSSSTPASPRNEPSFPMVGPGGPVQRRPPGRLGTPE